jgi:UDP-glucose 4-epimerase
MSTFLVTGAAGTIGGAVLSRLISGGGPARIIALDRRTPRETRSDVNVTWIAGNCGGPFPESERRLLAPVTTLVHLAADMSVERRPAVGGWTGVYDPVADVRELLRQLPQLAYVAFASSYMVYAVPPAHPIVEDSPRGPINLYGWQKCAIEDYLASIAIPNAALRFSGVYGPTVPLDAGRSVTELVRAAVMRSPVTLFGTGNTRRNHVYINDAAEAVARCAAERWRGRYNIAGPDAVSIRDVIELLEGSARHPLQVTWTDGPEAWDAVLDTRLVAQRHGFVAMTPAAAGLRRYYEYAVAQGTGVAGHG